MLGAEAGVQGHDVAGTGAFWHERHTRFYDVI